MKNKMKMSQIKKLLAHAVWLLIISTCKFGVPVLLVCGVKLQLVVTRSQRSLTPASDESTQIGESRIEIRHAKTLFKRG